MAQDEWDCNALHNIESTGADTEVLIHNQYQSGHCDWFICE